jgi:hypothetical protein
MENHLISLYNAVDTCNNDSILATLVSTQAITVLLFACSSLVVSQVQLHAGRYMCRVFSLK